VKQYFMTNLGLVSPLIFSLRQADRLTLPLVIGVFVFGLAGCISLEELSYTEPTPFFVNHIAKDANGSTLEARHQIAHQHEQESLNK
jgi:hypothetical protein